MKYEEKVDLLRIFNNLDGSPWSDEQWKEFMDSYRAFAAAMAKPILDAIDNSELRKSVKVIKHGPKMQGLDYNPIIVKPGARCFKGFGYWGEYNTAGPDGRIGTITCTAATDIQLGKVTPEAVEGMMVDLVRAIKAYEVEAVNMLKDAADVDNVILYIRSDFVPHDDPTLIKRRRIGVFGWEEIGVVEDV